MDVLQLKGALKKLVVCQFGTLYDLSLSSNTPVEDLTIFDGSLLALTIRASRKNYSMTRGGRHTWLERKDRNYCILVFAKLHFP